MAIEETFGKVPVGRAGSEDAHAMIDDFEKRNREEDIKRFIKEIPKDERGEKHTATERAQGMTQPDPNSSIPDGKPGSSRASNGPIKQGDNGTGTAKTSEDQQPQAGERRGSSGFGTVEETTEARAKPTFKVPTNLKEIQELLSPDGKPVTADRASEVSPYIQEAISKSNFALRAVAKRELEGTSPEIAEKNIEARLKLKLEPGAAEVIQRAVVDGANQKPVVAKGVLSASQSTATTGKDGEEKTADGKDGKKEKNWLEAIIDLIKTFAVALGIMDDPNKKDTAVAKKDEQTGQKTAKAEGQQTEQQKQTQLTPDEQKKSLAYLKELGDDFQNSIKNAGLKDTGIVLAGLPKGFTPGAQVVGAKLPTSDLQERG